ncbi:MAG: hypothetical protein H6720_19845 [Sandaracinus sp.]|nr:hypothetical protein [Sandaracinus sp.]
MRHRRLRAFLVALALFVPAVSVAQPSATSPTASSASSAAPNPFDAEQRRLVGEATRDRSPRGFLALLELWRHADDATPAVTRRALEELSNNRRVAADRRAYAAALLARMQVRAGERTPPNARSPRSATRPTSR